MYTSLQTEMKQISKMLTNPPHNVTLLEGTIRMKTIFKSIPLITNLLFLHMHSVAYTQTALHLQVEQWVVGLLRIYIA